MGHASELGTKTEEELQHLRRVSSLIKKVEKMLIGDFTVKEFQLVQKLMNFGTDIGSHTTTEIEDMLKKKEKK